MRRLWAVTVAVISCLLLAGTAVAGQGETSSAADASTCPARSDPDDHGPVGQTRPRLGNYEPVALTFDRAGGRIVAVAGSETWTFDVCTNTWERMDASAPSVMPAGLTHDPGAGVSVAIGEDDHVWTYDLAADAWTQRDPVPAGFTDSWALARLHFDPHSGLLFGAQPRRTWSYDTGRDVWNVVADEGSDERAERSVMTYDPSTRRLIAYLSDSCGGVPEEDMEAVGCTGDGTLLFDVDDRSWQEGSSAPEMNLGWAPSGGEMAYDVAGGRAVVFSDGRVVAYDATSDEWEVVYDEQLVSSADDLPIGPLARLGHKVVYDPINERLVVVGGQVRTGSDPMWVSADDVRAFDTRSREWTELLAPRRGYPAFGAWSDGIETDARDQQVDASDVGYAPPPSLDPSFMPDADGFVFEAVASGVHRLITDGADHFPSATYIREARDMDRLAVDEEGRVLVWSTTHGIDNGLAFDEQLWVLGREGRLSHSGEPLQPFSLDASRLAPDGSTWSLEGQGWGWGEPGRGVIRSDGETAERFLAGYDIVSLAITPDGRVWVAVGHDDGEAGGIYVIEPGAQGEPVDVPAAGLVLTATAGAAPIPVSSVTLEGAPFFVGATDESDMRRCSGLVVEARTVVDGEFLPESQCWDEGAVWWEDMAAFETGEPSTTKDRWIELELGGVYVLDGVIVQADDNDAYLLSYRDPDSGAWSALWMVPPAYTFGMATRPVQDDRTLMQALPGVVADALRFEADSGDGMYSVSEIQLFGEPAGD